MHRYYQDINDAAAYIQEYCIKWARLGGDAKEKYGTVRFSPDFGLSLHNLIYPGHCFYRFPKWLITADLYVITPMLNKLFGVIWHKWQSYIYRKAYKNAVSKWPHLRKEILCAADYDEFLEGL